MRQPFIYNRGREKIIGENFLDTFYKGLAKPKIQNLQNYHFFG
jgi:hypothetical protein